MQAIQAPLNRVVLRPEVGEQIAELGAIDILVGIPSYNNAATIEHVVRAIKTGFAKYFPDQRAWSAVWNHCV